jgi:hypothetical protein
MRNGFLLLLLLAFAMPVFALEKPPEVAKAIKAESPYGQGDLTKFFIHAYDAYLWTDAKAWSYAEPFALTIIYHYDFTTKELVDKTIEEMERIHATGSHWRHELEMAFPDVRQGERITALYLPEHGISFYHNGKVTRKIKSIPFAQQFIDIWLSEKTSEPSLRRKLLRIGR